LRTGYAQLPLHSGRAPRWLFERMVALAREVVSHIVWEYGAAEVLRRLSDPFWFQAFGCVLGFDWHSSGVTTTTCGAVKEGLKGLEQELGLFAAGGKGAVSRRTPSEIEQHCDRISLEPAPLVYASRMSAKVDSAALQDGYQIYHHAFFFTARGQWCVVQQGMNEVSAMARRYHWLGENLPSFVSDPHAAVCCDGRGLVLNLVASESGKARHAIAELARSPLPENQSLLAKLPELTMPRRHQLLLADVDPRRLQRVLLKTYERNPKDFEALLAVEGLGAKTLRALTLVSELIYGVQVSPRDPARFSFAHGGKDGTPYPVDRNTYDRTVHVLRTALERAKVERSEKVRALQRLAGWPRPQSPRRE
jgi:uncharacterized protein